jgi:hypothetical protein
MSASSPITSALSPSNLLLLHIHCSLCRSHFSLSMASEADQNPPVITEPTDGGNKSDSGKEGDALVTSSSMTLAAIKMADNQIPEIADYWKKSNVSEANHQAYHDGRQSDSWPDQFQRVGADCSFRCPSGCSWCSSPGGHKQKRPPTISKCKQTKTLVD